MPESEEEKKKRWAAAAAKSYMTPSMMHALSMSRQQSQKKYKEQFNKTKAKGYTSVASTPELENAKKQSNLVSQNKYKSEFEKNKAKFTQVADDPELRRANRASKQISNVEYHGKGSAICKTRRRRENPEAAAVNSSPKSEPKSVGGNDETSHHDVTHDAQEKRENGHPENLAVDEEQRHDVIHDDDETNGKLVEETQSLNHATNEESEDVKESGDAHEQEGEANDMKEVSDQEVVEEGSRAATEDPGEETSHPTEEGRDNSYETQEADDVTSQQYDNMKTNDEAADDVGYDDVTSNVNSLEIVDDHYNDENQPPAAPPESAENEPEEEQVGSLDDFYANLE